MNLQEAFDVAAGGMLRQGLKSEAVVGEGLQCAYRGAGGAKCALGHLMNDAAYDPMFDAQGLTLNGSGGAQIQCALEASGVDVSAPRMFSMLSALQEIHDCHDVCNWPTRLLELAAEFELDGRIIAQ